MSCTHTPITAVYQTASCWATPLSCLKATADRFPLPSPLPPFRRAQTVGLPARSAVRRECRAMSLKDKVTAIIAVAVAAYVTFCA